MLLQSPGIAAASRRAEVWTEKVAVAALQLSNRNRRSRQNCQAPSAGTVTAEGGISQDSTTSASRRRIKGIGKCLSCSVSQKHVLLQQKLLAIAAGFPGRRQLKEEHIQKHRRLKKKEYEDSKQTTQQQRRRRYTCGLCDVNYNSRTHMYFFHYKAKGSAVRPSLVSAACRTGLPCTSLSRFLLPSLAVVAVPESSLACSAGSDGAIATTATPCVSVSDYAADAAAAAKLRVRTASFADCATTTASAASCENVGGSSYMSLSSAAESPSSHCMPPALGPPGLSFAVASARGPAATTTCDAPAAAFRTSSTSYYPATRLVIQRPGLAGAVGFSSLTPSFLFSKPEGIVEQKLTGCGHRRMFSLLADSAVIGRLPGITTARHSGILVVPRKRYVDFPSLHYLSRTRRAVVVAAANVGLGLSTSSWKILTRGNSSTATAIMRDRNSRSGSSVISNENRYSSSVCSEDTKIHTNYNISSSRHDGTSGAALRTREGESYLCMKPAELLTGNEMEGTQTGKTRAAAVGNRDGPRFDGGGFAATDGAETIWEVRRGRGSVKTVGSLGAHDISAAAAGVVGARKRRVDIKEQMQTTLVSLQSDDIRDLLTATVSCKHYFFELQQQLQQLHSHRRFRRQDWSRCFTAATAVAPSGVQQQQEPKNHQQQQRFKGVGHPESQQQKMQRQQRKDKKHPQELQSVHLKQLPQKERKRKQVENEEQQHVEKHGQAKLEGAVAEDQHQHQRQQEQGRETKHSQGLSSMLVVSDEFDAYGSFLPPALSPTLPTCTATASASCRIRTCCAPTSDGSSSRGSHGSRAAVPLLKDSLAQFRQVAAAATAEKKAQAWSVYEGWPPRSRLPIGDDKSQIRKKLVRRLVLLLLATMPYTIKHSSLREALFVEPSLKKYPLKFVTKECLADLTRGASAASRRFRGQPTTHSPGWSSTSTGGEASTLMDLLRECKVLHYLSFSPSTTTTSSSSSSAAAVEDMDAGSSRNLTEIRPRQRYIDEFFLKYFLKEVKETWAVEVPKGSLTGRGNASENDEDEEEEEKEHVKENEEEEAEDDVEEQGANEQEG